MSISLRLKDKCVCCGGGLVMTQARFIMYGNYCSPCCLKAGNIASMKAKIANYEKMGNSFKRLTEKKTQIGLNEKEEIQIKRLERKLKETNMEELEGKKDKIIWSLKSYTDIDIFV